MIRSPAYAVHSSRPSRGNERSVATSASTIHIAQDTAPINIMTSYSDDGMSVHTSSTLPPSYHTRNSLLDPFQDPPNPILATEDADRQMPPAGPGDKIVLTPGMHVAGRESRDE